MVWYEDRKTMLHQYQRANDGKRAVADSACTPMETSRAPAERQTAPERLEAGVELHKRYLLSYLQKTSTAHV